MVIIFLSDNDIVDELESKLFVCDKYACKFIVRPPDNVINLLSRWKYIVLREGSVYVNEIYDLFDVVRALIGIVKYCNCDSAQKYLKKNFNILIEKGGSIEQCYSKYPPWI